MATPPHLKSGTVKGSRKDNLFYTHMSCILCCNGVSWLEGVKERSGRGVHWGGAISGCVNMHRASLYLGRQ